ncbi:menaquinone biosynthetic enzyme MqnA/MqnD family protein [Thermicanus aegyptius]|uniref:menaquinone biosynthetic enzyme MqnA/MqnD family protein n=1 Tax=Thermicanus aegyptius TaxID=94009 RepID=UPI0004279F3D|nr:menaquinone biosynthesis protein [Thermicanus aegyptius]
MLRIGKIDYTNTLPVFHYFHVEDFAGEVTMIPQVPAVLNRAMREGKVDLGPISSFAYGENYGKYLLLPDLSVSALGPVGSIFLFTKAPLESYGRMRVALTSTSATSVNLLKILFHFFLRTEVEYETMEPELEEMLVDHDGALLIGDDALRAGWGSHPYQVYDLGDLWHRFTGKWMTFAVWAVREEAYLENPSLLERVYGAFLASKERSRREIDPIIRTAQERAGGSEEAWRRYFAGLSHELEAPQLDGLSTYYDFAVQLGLLPVQPEMRLVSHLSYHR